MSSNPNNNKTNNEKKEEFIRRRRESREQCFAVMFEMTFTDDSVQDILDNAVESRTVEADDFMMNILDSFSEHKEEVDDIIKDNIKGWTFGRLSRVTLSVLRFAITELKFTDTPQKIVINEAVELSKKYSTQQEASFVNGVLGSVVRESEQ